MTGLVWVVLIVALMTTCYVLAGRHLRSMVPPPAPCRHERLRVLDGEVDSCWSCGQAMPRRKGTTA